jgi:hypothetical protein
MRDYATVFEALKDRRIWFGQEQSRYYDNVSNFFSNIFFVSIDRKISFVFVPRFILSSFDNIKEKYSDENAIKDENEARIHTLLRNNYIITPNEERKNRFDKVSFSFSEYPFSKEPIEDVTILYYVSENEFNKFSNEFYREYIEDEEDYDVTVVNMTKFNYIKFIIKNIITSDYFTDRDYEWLLSGNK